MTAHRLDSHHGRPVDVDACLGCQAFWFDHRESLQLAPASTLELFALIGGVSAQRKGAIGAVLKCPRCRSRLLETQDMQRSTAFTYNRCPHEHGRFITFFNFLREKNFVRPLTARQLDEMRRHVKTVNCSNCGAPIDLVKGSTCEHCGSPLALLDMSQAEDVVAQLRQASEPKAIDPNLPLELARARREVEAAFAGAGSSDAWWHDASSSGIVEVGLTAIARLLKRGG
jgi:hypothetical protein